MGFLSFSYISPRCAHYFLLSIVAGMHLVSIEHLLCMVLFRDPARALCCELALFSLVAIHGMAWPAPIGWGMWLDR
jgi:hypothetical protein